jgi:hypothetical protein
VKSIAYAIVAAAALICVTFGDKVSALAALPTFLAAWFALLFRSEK